MKGYRVREVIVMSNVAAIKAKVAWEKALGEAEAAREAAAKAFEVWNEMSWTEAVAEAEAYVAWGKAREAAAKVEEAFKVAEEAFKVAAEEGHRATQYKKHWPPRLIYSIF